MADDPDEVELLLEAVFVGHPAVSDGTLVLAPGLGVSEVVDDAEVSDESEAPVKKRPGFGCCSTWCGAGCERFLVSVVAAAASLIIRRFLDDDFLGRVHDGQENFDVDELDAEAAADGGGGDLESVWLCICFSVVMVDWLICSSCGMVGRCNALFISSSSSRSRTANGSSLGTLEMFSKRIVWRQLR